MAQTAYGSVDRPFPEQPFFKIAEVGWGGGFGVLTITRSGDNSVEVVGVPGAGDETFIGDYAEGDKIPHSDWQFDDGGKTVGYALAGVGFSDHSAIEPIYSDGDTTSTSSSVGVVFTDAHGPVPDPGDPPERGCLPADPSWQAIYDNAFERQANARTLYDENVAAAEAQAAFINGQGTIDFGTFTQTQHAEVFVQASSLPYFNNPPVNVELTHTCPGGTGVLAFLFVTEDDGATTSDMARVQWNAFAPAQITHWTFLRIDTTTVTHGRSESAFREVWLIDFGKLAKDAAAHGGPAEVTISQFSFPDPNMPGYENTYKLEIYGGADNFVAGPQQTVVSGKASVTPRYSATRSLAWDDPGSAQLKFNRSGWL